MNSTRRQDTSPKVALYPASHIGCPLEEELFDRELAFIPNFNGTLAWQGSRPPTHPCNESTGLCNSTAIRHILVFRDEKPYV